MSNAHDKLFKRAFGRAENAIGELESVLPAELLRLMELEKLEVESSSFVAPELAERHSDQLYSVPIAGREGFVYVLFEHRSTELWNMTRVMLGYMNHIWEKFERENPKARLLPAVVPVVLYHDATGWKAATQFQDLFDPQLLKAPVLRGLVPRFRFLVDDVGQATDEELLARQLSSFARAVLWALRDARSERLLTTLQTWSEHLARMLSDPDQLVDVETILQYILMVQGLPMEELISAIPSPAVREAAMSTAEQLKLRGRRELLRRQLTLKFGELGASALQRLEAADEATLDQFAERILTASSLDEFFSD